MTKGKEKGKSGKGIFTLTFHFFHPALLRKSSTFYSPPKEVA